MKIIIFSFLWSLPLFGFVQNPALELPYASNGLAFHRVNGERAQVYDMTIQNDKKVLLVGQTYVDGYGEILVARLNPNGSLDVSFGAAGFVLLGRANVDDLGNKIEFQMDGKILVSGSFYQNRMSHKVVYRLNTDGSLDGSFGIDGERIASKEGRALAQPGGKVLFFGNSDSSIPGGGHFYATLWDTSGETDLTYGSAGFYRFDSSQATAASCADAKFLGSSLYMTGSVSNAIGTRDIFLIKVTQDGVPDSSFATNGMQRVDLGSSSVSSRTLAFDQDENRIFVTGFVISQGDVNFFLICFDLDGNLDVSFGTNGKIVDAVNNNDFIVRDMLIQEDGKIVLVGNSENTGTRNDYTIVRYNKDGTLDTDFGLNGVVALDWQERNDKAEACLLHRNGSILVAGNGTMSNQGKTILLASILSSGGSLGTLNFGAAINSLVAHPVPIDSELRLHYTLESREYLTIDLYDIQGRIVRRLLDNQLRNSGAQEEVFPIGEQMAEGVYIIVVSNGENQFSVKVIK